MKKIAFIQFFLFFVLGLQQIFAQGVSVINPPNNSITVKKNTGAELLIPIDLSFVNTTNTAIARTINITIENTFPELINQLNVSDLGHVSVVNNNQPVPITSGATIKVPNAIYLLVDRTVTVSIEKIFFLRITDGSNTLSVLKVILQPEEQVLSLNMYLTGVHELDDVIKVESVDNTLVIKGFKGMTDNSQTEQIFFKKNVLLDTGEIYAVNDRSWIFQKKHWHPIPLSLTTIPFKIRPEMSKGDSVFKTNSTSGLANIGFNFDLVKYQLERYFSTGKKSTHRLSLGLWASPSVEELNSYYTNGFLAKDDKSKQVFISTGITISYTFNNDITLVFVPAGWDFSTSAIGRHWVYDGTKWWGFGIGISAKTFAAIFNK